MRLHDIRQTFLNYFESNQHTVVESSPLVPRNDPTLMFTAAGMVQFKDVFTGAEKRGYTRATTSQKCVRAGGKHNDLENVGYTPRHHTFFEMLGNFSFGDYFKEEAIFYAWTLLTKHFHLSPEKLLVTVFAEDQEAASLWKKITGFSDSKIIRIASDDNFWSMGDTGPCGPCTEIFYDHGEHLAGGPPGSPDEDGNRFVEIWNLVFMQYEKFADGRRVNLPKPSVDTGMGLERIGAVLQGVHSNFETDLFQSLIKASIDFVGNVELRQSHQVIADHLRASSFLIADGVLPSNEGRGYVLRRIMRRAMRHAHILGAKEPLMYRLAPILTHLMGDHYPELKRAESLVMSTLKQEEERFRETLERGLRLVQEEEKKLQPSQLFPGDVAFKLYDTYGFPVDLTADVLRGQGRHVDRDGFQKAMEAQKSLARASWAGSGEKKHDQVWFDVREKVGAVEFMGYDTLHAEAVVMAIIVDGMLVDKVSTSDITNEWGVPVKDVFVITNQTPFYGESGGQMGDHGWISNEHFSSQVISAFKPLEALIAHPLHNIKGTLKVGDAVKLDVHAKRRKGLRQHHSVTHLLHAALRSVLGSHVTQKGSLVEEDRLRFDFTHNAAVRDEELQEIESLVNEKIQENLSTRTDLKTPDAAIQEGAMALFGEKYGEAVRVVSMGDFSVELCGGTHVTSTGEIGSFKIMSESGIASGVRRMEAVAGMAALSHIQNLEKRQNNLSKVLKISPQQIEEKIKRLLEEKRILEQQMADFKQKIASGQGSDETVESINGIKLLVKHLKDYDPKDLKVVMDNLKKNLGSGIVFLSNVTDSKVSLLLGVTYDLTSRFKAGHMISDLSIFVDSQGGGGRDDLAQTGGSNPEGIEKAVVHLRESLGK